MTAITISLPETMHAYVQALAKVKAQGDVSAYLQTIIAADQIDRERQEIEGKLQAGLDQLNRGKGEEMTEEEWESLINS